MVWQMSFPFCTLEYKCLGSGEEQYPHKLNLPLTFLDTLVRTLKVMIPEWEGES